MRRHGRGRPPLPEHLVRRHPMVSAYTDRELEQLQALREDATEPVGRVVRRLVTDALAAMRQREGEPA